MSRSMVALVSLHSLIGHQSVLSPRRHARRTSLDIDSKDSRDCPDYEATYQNLDKAHIWTHDI